MAKCKGRKSKSKGDDDGSDRRKKRRRLRKLGETNRSCHEAEDDGTSKSLSAMLRRVMGTDTDGSDQEARCRQLMGDEEEDDEVVGRSAAGTTGGGSASGPSSSSPTRWPRWCSEPEPESDSDARRAPSSPAAQRLRGSDGNSGARRSRCSPAGQRRSDSGNVEMIAGVDVVASAVRCGVCRAPLKPPVFQCEIGHVVCAPCHGGGVPEKCHECGLSTGYTRCYAMERVVDSIHVPCPNAGRGCTVRTTYHQQETHLRACRSAPRPTCFCPATSCAFAGGDVAALSAHLATAHPSWPSTTMARYGQLFKVQVRKGYNVVRPDDDDDDGGRLFLLQLTAGPLFHVVTVACVQPRAEGPAPRFECELVVAARGRSNETRHFQSCRFPVECTSLEHGMPKESYKFLMPITICGVGGEGINLAVSVRKK